MDISASVKMLRVYLNLSHICIYTLQSLYNPIIVVSILFSSSQ